MKKIFLALIIASTLVPVAESASAIPGNSKFWVQVWDAAQGTWVWIKKNPVPATTTTYGGYSLIKDVYEDYQDCRHAAQNGAGDGHENNRNLTRQICSK